MASSKQDILLAQRVRNDLFLFSETIDFTEYNLSNLFSTLRVADDQYYNSSTPIFSDEEYDAIRLFCKGADPNNVYFLGIGAEVRGGKVKLPYSMGSLDQIYEGQISDWLNKHNLINTPLVITEKLDGVSAMLVYGSDGNLQIAYSRGNGIEGADITRHVRLFKSMVPKNVNQSIVVRGEIIFTKSNFDIIKTKIASRGGTEYKNARNCVAGLMNAEKNDPIVYDYLSFVAYDIINMTMDKSEMLHYLFNKGFTIPVYMKIEGHEATDEKLTKTINTWRKPTHAYEIDGIVIDVDSSAIRQNLRSTRETLNPAFAIKYKVADESNLAVSTVRKVHWSVSKDGYMKPRVEIDPVQLVGVTVTFATGFNAKFIKDNKIGVGAKIKITRSGDVIPFILEVVEPAVKTDLPQEDCSWNKTGVDLILKDAHTHDDVKLEQLIDFCSKMEFEYIGEGNIEAIFNTGVTTPTELVQMTENDFILVIGSANGRKIYKSIRQKLTNIPWYVVAGAHPAFGRGVGVRKMKKLYDAFAGDFSKLLNINNITSVEGFDFKTATKIIAGVQAFNRFLTAVGNNITFAKYETPNASGKFFGKSFCFTGFRSKELEAAITKHGGKVASGVSKTLTYLVALNLNEMSTKINKAQKDNVTVISRSHLEKMIED